jgi:hypothetical protein
MNGWPIRGQSTIEHISTEDLHGVKNSPTKKFQRDNVVICKKDFTAFSTFMAQYGQLFFALLMTVSIPHSVNAFSYNIPPSPKWCSTIKLVHFDGKELLPSSLDGLTGTDPIRGCLWMVQVLSSKASSNALPIPVDSMTYEVQVFTRNCSILSSGEKISGMLSGKFTEGWESKNIADPKNVILEFKACTCTDKVLELAESSINGQCAPYVIMK